MTNDSASATTRREFIKTSGKVAAVSALATFPWTVSLRAKDGPKEAPIQLALVGCGGRGTGAASQAMGVKRGPVKLIAMADVFEDKLSESYDGLHKQHAATMDVPKDRKFVGFDSYKDAMDCLKPGDIVILTTPLAFRWLHFTYAIEKGLNVFMEKPLTADGPCSVRMLKLAKDAKAKNLKVGVGLMCRHSRAMQELADRIHSNQIGDIAFMRGYRVGEPIAACFSPPKPADTTEVAYQIRRFHSFIWASGGCYSDFNIHLIDHLCWMKNDWPVKVQSLGGRHYRGKDVDQNFDNYSSEYTFADGSKMLFEGRCMYGCKDIYSSHVHGTKGIAVVSDHADYGMPSAIYKGWNEDKDKLKWTSNVPNHLGDPYVNEWNDLVEAIREDKPYNEVERAVQASLVTSMGRRAAHTGQEITYDQMLNDPVEFAPNIATMTLHGPAPVMSDPNGLYPVPQPGIITKTEYAMPGLKA